MDFSIKPTVQNTKFSKILEHFGASLASGDYEEISHLLSEDVEMILHNVKCFRGRQAVVDYLADWYSRYGYDTNVEMKWCNAYFQPALYLNVGSSCMVLLFYVNQGLIEKIMLTPRAFSKIGFSIDEYPYTVEFLEINAPKIISAKENFFFCPACGKASQKLKWREGVIFKKQGYSQWYGLIVQASICEDCNRVVEVYPDKTLGKVISMTKKQREVATQKMTEAERSRYVDGYLGNLRPATVKGLSGRSNHYGLMGNMILYSTLPDLIKEGKPELIFSHLKHVKLKDNHEINCHIATPSGGQMGDISYFFFNLNEDEKNILRHITAYASEDSAWEAYLMINATHTMPVFWHGAYHSRRFIFDEADINDIPALAYYDLTQLSASALLLPSVTSLHDDKNFEVCSTYWNEWKGLVRERLIICFNSIGDIIVKEEDRFILLECKCDICL